MPKRHRGLELSEHHEQGLFFEWWHLYSKTNGLPAELCFAVPNANKLYPLAKNRFALAKYLRAEGLTANVADIIMLIPRGGCHGLAIEMKRKNGSLRDGQGLWLATARSFGYSACVCRGFQQAQDVALGYLQGTHPLTAL